MADSSLVEYLRANRGSHTVEELRQSLLWQGAAPAEIEAAIAEVFSPPRRSFLVKAALGAGILLLLYLAMLALLAELSARNTLPGVVPSLGSAFAMSSISDADRQARADYRTHYLQPRAHMRLALLLFQKGIRSDAFHVLENARELFPKELFLSAHGEMLEELLRDGKLSEELKRPPSKRPGSKLSIDKGLLYFLAGYFVKPTEPAYHRSGGTREAIVAALRESRAHILRNTKSAEGLMPYLNSEDASMRAQACITAAQLNDPSLIDPLVNRLDDDMGNVRTSAGQALLDMSKTHRDQVLALWERLEFARSPFVRSKRLEIFKNLDPQRALPAIIKTLDDPEPYMRLAASRALVGGYESDPGIKAALLGHYYAEKDPEVLAALGAPMEVAVHNGETALEKKDYLRAIAEYSKVLQFEPEPEVARRASQVLGEANRALGRYPEAEAAFRRQLALSGDAPHRYLIFCDITESLSMQGKVGAAAESLRQCLLGSKKSGNLRDVLRNCGREPGLAGLRASPFYKQVLREFR